ncbi:MAG TPA: hypothetical protein VHE35_23660 [Kofleriaceae bacterium]|nr:hypothetical protein [Kofleriaceae bacterium]
MRTVSAAFAAMLALVAAGHVARADADGLTDALGPREIALGGGPRAASIGALATTLNPAGVALTHELVFEGSYGYRPDDSASLVALSACDSTNAAPGCFYYRYASTTPSLDGMDLHQRSHVGGLTLSRMVSPKLILGAGVKYFNVKRSDMSDDTDDTDSGINWDLGALARITDTLNLAVVGYNLEGSKSTEFPRSLGAGITIKPTPAVAAAFDALWNLDTSGPTGRYGGGIEYFVSTQQGKVGYPLRIGALHDVATGTFLSGGLGLATVKFGLDVGLRKQVSEGDELQVSASLRVFGPRM